MFCDISHWNLWDLHSSELLTKSFFMPPCGCEWSSSMLLSPFNKTSVWLEVLYIGFLFTCPWIMQWSYTENWQCSHFCQIIITFLKTCFWKVKYNFIHDTWKIDLNDALYQVYPFMNVVQRFIRKVYRYWSLFRITENPFLLCSSSDEDSQITGLLAFQLHTLCTAMQPNRATGRPGWVSLLHVLPGVSQSEDVGQASAGGVSAGRRSIGTGTGHTPPHTYGI